MMQEIALIADIHGNLPALTAVLADIEARGIRRVFSLGDVVGKGPQPREALALVRERCEKAIRGNWEDAVLSQKLGLGFISSDYVLNEIGPDGFAWLNAQPYAIFLRLSGKTIKLVHGRNLVSEVLLPDSPREKLLELMDTLDDKADVVGFADTHMPFYRILGGRTLFNIGAVGNPCDRLPMAAYAILRGLDSDCGGPFSVELVRVPYDVESAIQAATARPDLPFRQEYCDELRTALYQRRPYSRA